MTFNPPFSAPFRKTFTGVTAGGAWWNLFGAIPLANCVGAYAAKGAASYAASKLNLATPGINDLADGTAFPTWDATDGWTFTAASSQYLQIASGIITAMPITFVCLFNPVGVATAYSLMSIGNTANSHRRVLFANGAVGGDPIQAATTGTGGSTSANSTAGFTAGNWFVGAGVFTSTTSRDAYISGANKGSNTTSNGFTGTPNLTLIGARYQTTPGAFLDGKIRACAFYNTNLSDAQILALSTAMAAL